MGRNRMMLWLAVAGLWLGVLTATATAAEFITDLDLQLAGGYREDQIDWNIAGTIEGTSPNVISELTWEDLEIYQLRAKGKLSVARDDFPWFATCLKGVVGYGWIVDGENQDSDYLGDNRTLEFSRSNNSTEDDDVFDASLAVGPQFKLWEERIVVTPLIGWSHHEQNLRITDGVQTIADQALVDSVLGPGEIILPPLGPFSSRLNSTYETEWGGPWVGLDLELKPVKRLCLTGSAEYHDVDFEAKANWNLRSDFAHPTSFEHDAEGEGVVLSAAAKLDITENWSVEISYDWQDWDTDEGVILFYPAGGGVHAQQLNEVNWESQAVMLGVNYRFF